MTSLHETLAEKRIVLCVGSGGVGKTTLSAALGLHRALEGGHVLVCTIDPAKRLANALGLASLGNVETRVPEHLFSAAGLAPRGALSAMMLDVKRTWDDLVARYAPDEAHRRRIYDNPLYQQLSNALAGSQEYMAMEKLYELSTDRDYDLIVLDTPPTTHALDFLDAPNRMLDFLDDEAARLFLAPARSAGRLGLRLLHLGSNYAAKALSRFTGTQLLNDLAELLASFQGMYGGFKARAAAVRALLARPEVGFVVVSSTDSRSVEEALSFHQRLRASAMPIAGLIANRVTPDLWPTHSALPEPEELAAAMAALSLSKGERLAERLALTLEEHQRLARADAQALERMALAVGAPPWVLPRLDRDVHDLAQLARLASLM